MEILPSRMRRDYLGRYRSHPRSRPSARSCGDLLDLVGRHGRNLAVHCEHACPCRLVRTREHDLIHSGSFRGGSIHGGLAHGGLVHGGLVHGGLFRGGRDGSFHDGFLQQILIYAYMQASLAELRLYMDLDERGQWRLALDGVA